MKPKKTKISKAPRGNEGPTKERLAHDGGAMVEVVDRNLRGEVTQLRYKAKETCKLDRFLRYGSISEPMHRAGMKFAQYFFHAGKQLKVTVMYREMIGRATGETDPLVEKSDAVKGLETSLEQLTPDERDVVWTVCGQDNALVNRSDLKHLQTGLRALSIFYRYA